MFSNRFSPDKLADPMVRARLYREIRRRTPRISQASWQDRVVEPAETLLPELIAHREYGDHRLKWVILVAAGLDDYRLALESGETLVLPTIEWLRDRFRHYQGVEAVSPVLEPVKDRAALAANQPAIKAAPDTDAQDALQRALEALDAPTPLVSPRDAVNDESLNRQRNAIEDKLQAVRDALARLEVSP